MSVVQAASKGLIWVCGPTVAMFMVCAVAMWKPMIHAPSGYKGQGSYFGSDVDDCRCPVGKEGHRRLLRQPLTLPLKVTAYTGSH